MDLFPATFADLQNVLSRDSGRYFDEFLGIAVGNASLLKFDSVVWAHGQMHAMIGDFLDPKNGYQKLATVREWIKDYCDGPVTMDESAFSSPQQFERALLRSDWRAPTWLQAYPCSRSSSNSEASVALEMTSQEETEKVLKVLAERFWMQIEYHLAHRARLARIGLAKQGALRPTAVPSDTPPCKKNIKTLSPFRELAGRLMHDARSKEPDRFRDETWIEICSKLDAAAFKPLIKYLEGKARDQLANWNQKHSNRPLRTFTEGIRPPAGAMFVRRGIQRTLYRTQEKCEE